MNKCNSVIFTGAATALVTPFKNHSVDFNSLANLIEFNLSGGVNALVVSGTTGEAPTLDYEEHKELLEFTVKAVRGRVPVIAGIGSNCTARSVLMAEYSGEICDGLLAVAPYYNKPSPEGLFRHFESISKSTVKPIIIYNVPSRAGCEIPLEIYDRLSDFSNLAGIKEASGNVLNSERILCEFGDRFSVYSGCDELTLPILSVGGKGVISVLSNVAPRAVSDMCSAWFSGDFEVAKALQIKYLPLIRALFSETNPIPVKALLSMMKLCTDEMRLPLCPPSEAIKSRLKSAAVTCGILPV